MILPYVGFFPWEIIFLLLADAFFFFYGLESKTWN